MHVPDFHVLERYGFSIRRLSRERENALHRGCLTMSEALIAAARSASFEATIAMPAQCPRGWRLMELRELPPGGAER